MEEFTLDRVFNSPEAKITDLYHVYKEQHFTTSMAAAAIKVSFKTALRAIDRLEGCDVLVEVPKIRNAKAYKFNKKSPLVEFMRNLK